MKNKADFSFIIFIIIFFIISIISIWSAENILSYLKTDYTVRQIIWYIIGFILLFIFYKIKYKYIIQLSKYLYIIINILLLLLLIFGKPINNAKCWIQIPYIGAFQPSEFMKITLIIILSDMVNKFNIKYKNPTVKNELLLLLKVFVIVGIPCVLTFLEPDTGVVLIYLFITLLILFISGLRYRWFFILFIIIFIILFAIIFLYFNNTHLFIQIFGSSFFLRVERLLDWSKGNGYQLDNGITAIGSGGILGFGFNKTPIYIPEAQTDFIFAIIASNYGYIGSLILLCLLLIFDLKLIFLALKTKGNKQYIIIGTLSMLIYQQIQNIGMTYGLFPITGITLPFISYGGSSLLSYMIIMGIILKISKQKASN